MLAVRYSGENQKQHNHNNYTSSNHVRFNSNIAIRWYLTRFEINIVFRALPRNKCTIASFLMSVYLSYRFIIQELSTRKGDCRCRSIYEGREVKGVRREREQEEVNVFLHVMSCVLFYGDSLLATFIRISLIDCHK